MGPAWRPVARNLRPALLLSPLATSRGWVTSVRPQSAVDALGPCSVDAARVVFERVGYLDARLSDITAEAGCSTGTFYTYFKGKDEVMAAVLRQVEEDMLEASGHRSAWTGADPVALIAANNRAYFEAYQRNSKLMRCLEQVAVIEPRFQETRYGSSSPVHRTQRKPHPRASGSGTS